LGFKENGKKFETEAEAAKSVKEIKKALLEKSNLILEEDQKMDQAIGEHALELLEPGMGLLTHCNAGGLATSYITAIITEKGIIKAPFEKRIKDLF